MSIHKSVNYVLAHSPPRPSPSGSWSLPTSFAAEHRGRFVSTRRPLPCCPEGRLRPNPKPHLSAVPSGLECQAGCFPALKRRNCLPPRPRIRQERGIYPAGTPARQIRAWKFQDSFADQSSRGLKSALRSLAQRIR